MGIPFEICQFIEQLFLVLQMVRATARRPQNQLAPDLRDAVLQPSGVPSKTSGLRTVFDPDQLPTPPRTCIVMAMLLQMIINSRSMVAVLRDWVKEGVIWVRDPDQSRKDVRDAASAF